MRGNPRISRCRIAVMLLLCVAMAGTAFAQTTTATLRGRITDEGRNPFPTAEVTAVSVTTGYRHTAVAGADGSYLLGGLTPGLWRIEVVAPAYRGTSRELSLQVGQTITADFSLRPDTVLTEEMTVIGSVPVEMETSEISTNVTRRQIENLPQNDRNFLNFAALAPGVQLGNDEFRKEVKAGAQTSSATNVFIDGVSFKNDVLQGGVVGQDASRGNPFPQNAVQEFRVITQNFSAEYQKASSAIITAITKSGGNELTGDAFFYFQDKSLVDENPLTGANPEYERNQYGLSVGGPVVRDRMHFFASYEANDQTREETVVISPGAWLNHPSIRQSLLPNEGVFASPFRSDLFFGKLSYQPASSMLFDLSGHYRNESDIRSFGGFTSRESAENVNNDVWGATLRNQYTATTWLNEASVSLQESSWNPTALNMNDVGLEYEGLLRVGGRDTTQDVGQQRLAFRNDTTFSGYNWFGGDHTLKIGGNVEFLDYTVKKLFVENPVFYFRQQDPDPTIPYKARFGFGDPDLSAENQQYGIYAQDDWSVNDRLILNLGLRWDYETNMFDTDYVTPVEVRTRLADQFPANYFTDGNDREPKTDMFQPRLGFSYDLFANGKTVAFGGVGRYYDRNLFNNTLDERFRLQHAVYDFFFSADGTAPNTIKWEPRYMTPAGLREVIGTGLTGKPEVFLVENDTEVPYSNQWNLGVRQSFGTMVASASYANVRSYHGFSYVWGQGFCCPEYDAAYAQVLVSSDDIRTWYDAVYLQLDRPYSEQTNFGFNIAYTWSDAEQIGGDLFSLDLPRVEDWPRYGTPGTSDHRIVANAIVGIPFGIRASALVQYSSGDKFRIHNRRGGFCSTCYVPETGESPDWTTIDLRFDKEFNVGRGRVGLVAEGFNLLNEERYQFFNDFVGPEGNPNLGQGTVIVGGSQRRYQFGVRLGF
jgi:hypothetical protein